MILLLLSCAGTDWAALEREADAHRAALILPAGDCWGLDQLASLERLPSCVPGPPLGRAAANERLRAARSAAAEASPETRLWLAANAQRSGSLEGWVLASTLIADVAGQGLSWDAAETPTSRLLPGAAVAHVMQWEHAQLILSQRDGGAAKSWFEVESYLASQPSWTAETLDAIPWGDGAEAQLLRVDAGRLAREMDRSVQALKDQAAPVAAP